MCEFTTVGKKSRRERPEKVSNRFYSVEKQKKKQKL